MDSGIDACADAPFLLEWYALGPFKYEFGSHLRGQWIWSTWNLNDGVIGAALQCL